jgi:hypothetical protein
MTPAEIKRIFFNSEAENVCLLGSAPASLRLAPFGNANWAMIGCSPGVYGVAPRNEAWVELHRYEPGQPWFSPEYCQFLINYPGPVWMAEKRPEIKNSVELPLEMLIQKYSPYFFSSSLAYMMAMAIEAQFKKIALFGVDMAAATEYKDQRLGCQYFAIIARAHGIEVGVPPESDLFRPAPLYGVSETSHARIKFLARRRELESRLAECLQGQAQAKDTSLFLRGALEDLEWAEMDWLGNVDGPSNGFLSPPIVAAMQQYNFTMTPEPEQDPVSRAYGGDFIAAGRVGEVVWTVKDGEPVEPRPDGSPLSEN